jgi:hypothetical protein
VVEILQNEDRARELGERAHQSVIAQYSWGQTASQVGTVLASAVHSEYRR